ncbi:MAG: GNAT family N-acetyltransferase [Bacteroidetes bacterium]|nr:GNAT family N-acetyltransferase [Bacteroidota bacterium]MBS1973329.1 GNAT family N-acetyltransferase [Bacteroidota bacterium]
MKKASNDDYFFSTFWLVIEKPSRNVVAELGFKGAPNERGEVEIGYGTFFGYRRKGFMTEAVGGMINWAASRPGIKFMLAETDENNMASAKVLQKNGFVNFDKREKMLWWRIEIKACNQNFNATPV